MRWFIWLSQLFYLLLLLHFQFTSSSSSFFPLLQHYCAPKSRALQSASFLCDNSYPKMKSWKVSTDCCSWDGVTCDRVRGDVIGLDLSCSWLYGTIPSNISLFLLPHLQHLNLAFNDFSFSPISSGFGQFARLRYLNLSGSWFSSQVPLKLSHLSQLTSLDLSHNGFVYLEASFMKRLVKNMTKLRELQLDEVDMSLVSVSSFMNLSSSLTSLTLEACQLSGRMSNNIFHLPNLCELNLKENRELMGVFPMANWTNPLRFLDVSSMTFSRELSKSIGNLNFLRNLGLNECSFTGSVPTSLGNLTQLTHLDLSYNDFSGEIPSLLSKLKELSYLALQFNQLTRLIPASLGSLMKVTEIFLKSNNFIGHIPSSLSFLKDLRSIDLSNNNFEGKIPNFLTNFRKLIEVDFLSLSIKSKLNYSFLALQHVKLVSRNIIEFPNFLTLSKKLDYLDLSNNRIYGRIPEWMFEIGENLSYLNLSHNFLSSIDRIPWKNLIYLDLRDNLLQGKFPIPPFSTEILFISNNSLTGNIPSMICNISSLRLFDISHNMMDLRMNNFHGAIPDTFAKDNQLITLVFNGNLLEGLLPKSLVNCKKMEVLDLGNNKINDRFPYWLEALPELKVLVLKSNRFYDPIGNHKTSGNIFSKLRILDLSHNEFTGFLPRNYFQNLNAMTTKDEGKKQQYMGETDYYQDSMVVIVKGLDSKLQRILTIFTTIDLSSNKFEGEIPKLTGHIPLSLANLSALESLDLSSNRLVGEIPIQMTSLTFLAKLNLSRNQLTGPIPQGKQFGTFENDPYYGNLGLYGFPLSIECSNDELTLPTLPSIFQEDNVSLFSSGFGWKAVLTGYGCGLLFGLAMGYAVFKMENLNG
ncbi:hypothetical protein RGQ29_028241 [Quercus rubra]|uniref:Leucine-rich repeat-containing N-terminal plant-type domain-containing protein n=1 Tax=Quercus rubra TaxID=3512 RepID=A0AAN7IEP5_QUERU|nr:hypothetical protein RGQ29_028241 [Quercus rubra]